MDLGLEGRVALVAASSAGLGFAVAREFVREGTHVSIFSRSRERVEAARERLAGEGPGQILARTVDARDEEAVTKHVEETVQRLGGLDIVVANAGGPPAGSASDFGTEAYRDALELNLLSSISLVSAALPHIRGSSQGRVLFITSITVKQPLPSLALSNTARAGIVGYSKSLVAELGSTGPTVNVLAPGYTRTTRLQQLEGDDIDQQLSGIVSEIPLGRVGEPEEFAAAAAFLASSRASFITGTVISVDGGQVRSLL